VRPELGVDAVFVALVEEIKVLLAQRRQKRIRVVELPDLAAVQLHTQLVAEDLGLPGDENLEETAGRELFHRPAGRGSGHERDGVAGVDYGAFRGFPDEGTHDHPFAAAPFRRVHAQQAVGLVVFGFEQGFKLGLGDFHRDGRVVIGWHSAQLAARV